MEVILQQMKLKTSTVLQQPDRMLFPQEGIEKLGQDPLLRETGFLSRVLQENLQGEEVISRSVLEAVLRIVSRPVQEPPSGSIKPVLMDVLKDAQAPDNNSYHRSLPRPYMTSFILTLTNSNVP